MKINKLLSIVLIFSVMLTCVCIPSMAEDAPMPEDNVRQSLFDALGISVNTTAQTVNRGEFATQVALAAGSLVHIGPVEDSGFEDVKPSSSVAKYIKAVCDAGIMNGVGGNTFAPNGQISTTDAIVALVRLAGYESAAIAYGGYPSGYLRVASDRKITLGVQAGSEPLSGSDFATLLYNVLHTDVYVIVSMGGSVSYVAREGEDVLYVYHDIKAIDAKVTSNRFTSLFSVATSCKTDEIELDNQRYKTTNDSSADYLGMAVKAYIKQSSSDKIGTVVAISADTERGNVLTLSYDDIESFKDNTFYWFDGSKERKATVERGFSFIYNGKLYEDGKISELWREDSTLTLIDGDGDKNYETVSCEHGETVVVANVDRTKYVIYGENGKHITYDDSEQSSYLCITDKDGAESYIDRIKSGNVITVYSSKDGQYVNIVISTDTVKGTIVELDSKNRTAKLKTNKETLDYKIATGCEADFTLGLSGEFYVDAFGKLVYSKNKPGSDYEYGYLYAGRFESPMSAPELMILTSADFEVFKCADSVVVDGNKLAFSKTEKNVIYDGTKFMPQMIRFKKDGNGIIKYIDTENVGTGDVENDRLNPSQKTPVSGSYTPYFASINSKCQIGADTLFIKAPGPEATDFKESYLTDKNYYSNSKESLGEGKSFAVAYAYEMDDTLTPKAIVYYNNSIAVSGSGRMDNYTPIAVVLEHFSCLDSEGDAREAIRVYTENGKEEVLYFKDEYNVPKSMEFGDVIFYLVDNKNCITQWAYDFDYSERTSEINDGYWPRYVGYTYSKGDNAFSFLNVTNNENLSEDREYMTVFPTKVMRFIEVDFETRRAEKITYADIDSYKHTKNTDKLSYVKVYRGGGNYEDIMFVYKNRP